jgi:hypothetical protein
MRRFIYFVLRIKDLGFGIWDLGFGIWDLGFGIWDLGFKKTQILILSS